MMYQCCQQASAAISKEMSGTMHSNVHGLSILVIDGNNLTFMKAGLSHGPEQLYKQDLSR